MMGAYNLLPRYNRVAMRIMMRKASFALLWTLPSSPSSAGAFAPKSRAVGFHSSVSCSSKVPDFMSALYSSAKEVDPGVVEGTDLLIAKYPRPSLRAENAEISVEELKESTEIASLAKGMLKVMYAAAGVGLAAPQVGVNKRLMVYNPSGDSTKWLDETILVNPKIVEYSDAKDTEIEGCLSFPDMSGEVTRSKWIKVQAMNLRGRPIKKKFTGWEARIFQHEYDHLDGVVYIDRLINEEERSKVQPRLDELIAEYGEGGAI
jgi:peptide deformylase